VTGPTRIVLVRHALPADGGLVLPVAEVGLGEAGHEQARLLASRVAAVQPTALYSSPRPRAVQTARPIADLIGIEPEIVADLRELDFGELEGMSFAEIERRYPELVGWTSAPSSAVFPRGESIPSVRERAAGATRAIALAHPGGTAVVVCHGVVIRVVLAEMLRMPLDAIFRLEIPYCGVSVIDWFGDRPLVRSINGSL
jgi:alpha-ribazole phosphatase/probable phosphoglycerate mutase